VTASKMKLTTGVICRLHNLTLIAIDDCGLIITNANKRYGGP